MSRSSTERAAAGLAIGRDYLGVAERAAGKARAMAELPLATPLFVGAPSAAARETLARALREIAGGLARRYLPLHVSLPDALVRWAVFELDELPGAHRAQLELAAFRFSRQGLNGKHAYTCQPLGDEGGKRLLLGMAADAGWLALVDETLQAAGIMPWTISANACRQFNAFHDEITRSSGALVALAPDAWSLSVWDARARPRYIRGRWRSAAAGYDDIALEVERSILAYVHAHPEREVARLFVAGGEETFALKRALDARLREPCSALAAEAEAGTHCPPSAPVALAAALEQ